MMSLQSRLKQIGTALATVTTNCYHYWRPVKTVPCIIWAEDGEDGASYGDNRKTEQVITGTVDFFTKTEFDPLADTIQATLDSLGLSWALESVQYEEETGFIHMEWDWGVANGEDNDEGT